MSHQSVQFKIILWNMIAMLLVASVLGACWHFLTYRTLMDTMDDRIKTVAGSVASIYGSVDDSALGEKGIHEVIDNYLDKQNIDEHIEIIGYPDGFLRYVFESDENIVSGRDVGRHGLLNTSLSLSGVISPERWDSFQPMEYRGRLHQVYVHPVQYSPGTVSSLVVVGKDISYVDGEMSKLRRSTFIFSPLLIMFLGGVGFLMARRSLLPFRELADKIESVKSSADLSARLDDVAAQDDEVARIATAFNNMLENLENSFKRIKRFTGDASHEMKTPLTIMKSELEVGMRWSKTTEEFQGVIKSCYEETLRLEKIIEDMLFMARHDSGKAKPTLNTYNLIDQVTDVYLVGRQYAETVDTGVEVRFEFRGREAIPVLADRDWLNQLLNNLAVNGVKYNRPGGTLDIILTDFEDKVAVCFKDSGFGIDKENFDIIFDPYVRVDESRNRKIGGTGLGLSIAKRIADMHNGKIFVSSEKDKGSSFTVELPKTEISDG